MQNAPFFQTGTQIKHVVLFLHGYGANGDDLLSIGRDWQDSLPDTLFIAPNAPYQHPYIDSGYMWFDFQDKQNISPNDVKTGLNNIRPIDRDITLMFYFAVGTMICAFIPLTFVWQAPSLKQLGCLAFLGLGGNLIQVCIYRAFSATEASGLMPFRYTSLLIASIAEFTFFGVIPTVNVLIGAVIIIAAACYIATHEKRKEANQLTSDLQIA